MEHPALTWQRHQKMGQWGMNGVAAETARKDDAPTSFQALGDQVGAGCCGNTALVPLSPKRAVKTDTLTMALMRPVWLPPIGAPSDGQGVAEISAFLQCPRPSHCHDH